MASSDFATAAGTAGAVAFWRMSEGSGTSLADSEGGSSGTLNAGTWHAATDPLIGAWITMVATTTAHSGGNADLPVPTNFPQNDSVSFVWLVRTTDAHFVDAWGLVPSPGLVTNTPSAGQNLFLFEYNGDSTTGLDVDALGFTIAQFFVNHVTARVATPSVNWRDGSWHMMTFTYTFATKAVTAWIDEQPQTVTYVDYTGSGIGSNPVKWTTSGEPLTYGPGASTSQPMTSDVSGFGIFPTALTQTDVDNLYTALTTTGGESHSGTAALAGSGALSVLGAIAVSAAVALSGAGSLTATGTPAAASSVALSGSGTLTAAGAPSTAAAASLSGSGALATTGSPSATGAVGLSGSGSLTAAGTSTEAAAGAATLTGTGTLTATGSATEAGTGTANLTGAGALTVTAAPTATGTATLTGSGSLAATGTASQAGAATVALTGDGTLTAAGQPAPAVPVSLSGSGTLTATGHPGAVGTVTLTGGGSLSATAIPATTALAAFTGSGTLTATGSGSQAGDGTPVRNPTLTLTSATSTLTLTTPASTLELT